MSLILNGITLCEGFGFGLDLGLVVHNSELDLELFVLTSDLMWILLVLTLDKICCYLGQYFRPVSLVVGFYLKLVRDSLVLT